MSVVNRITINPNRPFVKCFSDISMGQLFRAVNRRKEDNVYMKIYTNCEHKAIALWSGDVCSPAADMEIELIPSVTLVSV